MATTVAKGVAKEVLYFNALWCSDLAIGVAVAANSDKASQKTRSFIDICQQWTDRTTR